MVGWSPRDIDRLTLAEFGAAIDGWIAAHTPSQQVEVTEDEFARVLAEEMAAGRA